MDSKAFHQERRPWSRQKNAQSGSAYATHLKFILLIIPFVASLTSADAGVKHFAIPQSKRIYASLLSKPFLLRGGQSTNRDDVIQNATESTTSVEQDEVSTEQDETLKNGDSLEQDSSSLEQDLSSLEQDELSLEQDKSSPEQDKLLVQDESPEQEESLEQDKSPLAQDKLLSDADEFDDAKIIPAWKQNMPEPLRRKGPRTFQKIEMGPSCDVYLLGTAHVSNDSSADVRALLEYLDPTCIFVELCDARIPLLEGEPLSDDSNEVGANVTLLSNTTQNNATTNTDEILALKKEKQPSFWDRVKATKESQGGSRFQAMSTVLLTSVQEDYATELGVELGGEFRCAHRYWQQRRERGKNREVPYLVLGDRPLHLTLVRAWESLWWWPKFKVIAGLMWSSFRKPDKEEIKRWLESVMNDESDVLTESFQELRKHFPTLYTTIIEERDAWLSAKIVQTSRALVMKSVQQQLDHGLMMPEDRVVIVAIVGAGHIPGICAWLTKKQSASENETPEQVLTKLVATRRWANDEEVQKQAVPIWINEVTQLQDRATTTTQST